MLDFVCLSMYNYGGVNRMSETVKVTFTIDRDALDHLDALSDGAGMSRSAYIEMMAEAMWKLNSEGSLKSMFDQVYETLSKSMKGKGKAKDK